MEHQPAMLSSSEIKKVVEDFLHLLSPEVMIGVLAQSMMLIVVRLLVFSCTFLEMH